ncbi:MAG: DUF721 domain-containing protein [Bacteroidia bacterium]|nr:DUF721 domain-containing protein [Bacteroidia bacterium]
MSFYKPYMSVGEAINAFLKKHGLQSKAAIQSVIGNWETIMGTPIAQNTDKIWFDRGVLYVKMSSPVWRGELQMARNKIREVVNKEAKSDIVQEVRVI